MSWLFWILVLVVLYVFRKPLGILASLLFVYVAVWIIAIIFIAFVIGVTQ